ncbi:MAG: PcfJ domain-containing protein [Acutalibacteraceae bacterium]
MVYKRDLLNFPFAEMPKLKKRHTAENIQTFVVTAQIKEFPNSGEILCVDYIDIHTGTVYLRFFASAEQRKYLIFIPAENEFTQNSLTRTLPDPRMCEFIDIDEAAFNTASEFLGNTVTTWYTDDFYRAPSDGVTACCEAFCSDIRRRKNQKAFDSRWQLQAIRHALFKKNKRVDLAKYYKKIKPFENDYIFFSNLDNKQKRKGFCSHCLSSFKVPAKVKHNEITVCPVCGKKVRYCADRYSGSKHDKIKLLYIDFIEDYMTYELEEVERCFDGHKPIYYHTPKKRTLNFLRSGKKLSCSLIPKAYVGWDWTYFKQWAIEDESYIYCTDYDRLKKALGIEHIDFQKVAESAYFGNFEMLIRNLKKYPVTEYLLKTGLSRMASSPFHDTLNIEGHGFSDVFGVSKQMYPMYRDERVTLSEHICIRRLGKIQTPQWLSLYRMVRKSTFTDSDDLNIVLSHISIEKLCNYLEKQTSGNKLSKGYILNKLADYYSMAKTLKIPITKKNATPKKLLEYHDHLYVQIQSAKDELYQKQLEEVNEFFPGFSKSEFVAFLPQKRSDLIVEGQMLSHCVGSDRYFNSHLKGLSMIFFIRHADEPDKPFYTAEINMSTFTIVQLYGYRDCQATKEVRKFTEALARFVSKIKKHEVLKAS